MSQGPEESAVGGDWGDVVRELRQIRRHVARSEEELWDAVEEIRDLLVDGERGASDPSGGPTSTADGHRMAPADYRRLKRRLRRFVTDAVPVGATLAVVSRGDGELLDFPGVQTQHFPRNTRGGYAGYYPADGTSAIAHLEWVRASGVDHLLFPATADWWFAAFPLLAAHLEARYAVSAREAGVGVLFDLSRARSGSRTLDDTIEGLLGGWERAGDTPALLDWGTGLELERRLSGRTVFSPPLPIDATLPYLDDSVTVVVVRDGDRHRLAEARRVATRAVVRLATPVPDGDPPAAGARVEHLASPPPGLPSVSVVMPTYNGVCHVRPCVRALAATLPEAFSGEVLVVDDGSGPETRHALAELAERHPWLRVTRNDRNRGFIASCNRGAEEAAGEYLVFLNDDTVPLPGWLDALIETFRTRPDAGAVGGRLIYPDGSLQEAGGVIYRDGSGANVGRGDFDVDAPLYQHVREVDYCSGALLATPRHLFDGLGGFDTRYRPAYYEDTDYCFRVRAAGHAVYYQPASTIVHTEGGTSGTDPSSGAKRHQRRNRGVFSKRWTTALETRPEPPTRYTGLTWARLTFGEGAR